MGQHTCSNDHSGRREHLRMNNIDTLGDYWVNCKRDNNRSVAIIRT